MTQIAAAAPGAANDARIDPQIRSFLAEINKDSSPFWQLPQPKPQEILTSLQNKTPVDMSGVTTVEKTIVQEMRENRTRITMMASGTGRRFWMMSHRVRSAGISIRCNISVLS